MKRRKAGLVTACLVVISSFHLVLTVLPTNVTATDLFVGGGGPGNYTAIQDAINASSPGSSVYVYPGIYYERLTIDKPLSLIGEDMNTTTIDNNGGGTLVTVESDSVNISGFKLNDSSDSSWVNPNIYMNGVRNCRIAHNNISGSYRGIKVENSAWLDISDNILFNIGWQGVWLISSDNTTIKNNFIAGDYNWSDGSVDIEDSDDNTIVGNEFSNAGISLTTSSHNEVMYNTISSSGITISWSSTFNDIIGNNVSLSSASGIGVVDSSYNDILGNNLSGNNHGGVIALSSSFNTIADNTITLNGWYGIHLYASTSTDVLNNNMSDGGILIDGWDISEFNTHNIPSSNVVDGDPVYYFKNCNGIDLDGVPAGQAIFANCVNSRVRNLQIGNVAAGIEIAYSNGMNVSGNSISDSKWSIYFVSASWNEVSNNSIENNERGIYLTASSDNNTISNNAVSSTVWDGISIMQSSSNDVVNNVVTNGSGRGVYVFVFDATDNSIIGNDILYNSYGITVFGSGTRVFHNNFIDNDRQAVNSDLKNNLWNDSYPSGGNYWSDYIGFDNCSGPNQDICPDPDGIGDTSYDFDSDGHDYYPLMVAIGGDVYPPLVQVSSHSDGEIVNDSPITLSGSAEDVGGSGLSHVEVSVNGSSWTTAVGTSSWSIDLDLEVGPNPIEVKAWDNAGNPSETAILSITYNLLASVEGCVVSSDGNPIENADVELAKDDGTLTLMDVTNTIGQFGFSDIPLGVYTITITASGYEDLILKNLTFSSGFHYDLGNLVMTRANSYPIASFTIIPGTGSVDTVFTVDASASYDLEDSISELEVRWDMEDDGVWDTTWSITKTAQIQYPSLGDYTIRLEIRDTDGLMNQTTRLVTVTSSANQSPTCNITVVAGSSASGIYQIQGTAHDPDGTIESVEIRIDYGDWVPATGTNHWTFDWNTTLEDNGAHTIYARSYDGENYSAEANVTVIVDNPGPPTDDGSQDDWLWLALAVIIVIAFAVLLTVLMLIRRRKKSSEVEEPPGPPPEEQL